MQLSPTKLSAQLASITTLVLPAIYVAKETGRLNNIMLSRIMLKLVVCSLLFGGELHRE